MGELDDRWYRFWIWAEGCSPLAQRDWGETVKSHVRFVALVAVDTK
jgi:hypothetical protein